MHILVSTAIVCAVNDTPASFHKTRDYVSGQFTDVAADAWYTENVRSAYELGLINGISDTNFGPEKNMSIAQAITIASRIHSIYNDDHMNFTASNPWYQSYIDYAVKEKIIAENKFSDYDAPATRAQVAAIFAASLPESEFKAINSIEPGDIYDVSPSERYSASVYKLYNAGIITGSDVYGTFHPASNIKRSEVSAIINRIVDPSERVTFTPKKGDPVDIKIRKIINNMTLQEKVYQLFIIRPEALTGASKVTTADESTKNCLKKYPVGGIIYFADNLVNPGQTKNMLHTMSQYAQEIEGMPLFLCVDEEGGRVARIGKNPAFKVPKIVAMQNIKNREEAYRAGSTIGTYLSDLGFNWDFAPVADVLTVSGNTDIGNRSFGSDPNRVTQLASAVSAGLQEHNIMSTFKHYPGDGATSGNTHKGFAQTKKTLAQLYQTELKPFMAAEENGVDAIMAGHISVPNVTGDNTPASLSPYMISDVLRRQLNFSGIVITDSLGMGAVSNTYGADRAAVLAFKAGNDILLMPQNFHSAANGILQAVKNGEITEARINESLYRIVKTKVLMSQ